MDFKPPPIPQILESVNKINTISIPRYGYSRNISPAFFSCISSFYEAFQANHSIKFSSRCACCKSEHSSALLCLPDEFSPFVLDFLIDFLEGTPQGNLQQQLLPPVIRLCGFLLIETRYIFAMIQLYVPCQMRRPSSFTRALVNELNSTGYHQLGHEFASTYMSQ